MIYNHIKEIPYHRQYAVIINCGTKLSTTLAILSANRYLDIPLLVVDCRLDRDSEGYEYQYFVELQKQHEFNLIQLPLRKHGETLDFIFTHINADFLCLIDSDLEILNDRAIKWMQEYVTLPNVFGSGFIQGPYPSISTMKNCLYAERMWIPFTYLKVKPIKDIIINNKVSFKAQRVWNNIPCSQTLSFWTYKYLTQRSRFFDKLFNISRKKYGAWKPVHIMYDTGALVYNCLEKEGYIFSGPKDYLHTFYANHYDGITRGVLDDRDYTATKIQNVEAIIENRLKIEYNFNISAIFME